MTVQTMLIDDDRILHFLMKKMLALVHWNFPFSTFENGQKALEYFIHHYQPEVAYVIFLDINMPIIDGWEFLTEIDKIVPQNHKVSVFVLSSSINLHDKERAEQHRLVKEFISKPIAQEKLRSINEYFSKN